MQAIRSDTLSALDQNYAFMELDTASVQVYAVSIRGAVGDLSQILSIDTVTALVSNASQDQVPEACAYPVSYSMTRVMTTSEPSNMTKQPPHPSQR